LIKNGSRNGSKRRLSGINMVVFSVLKWFSYIFTGGIVLLFGVRFVMSLANPSVALNQATKTCLITGASSGIGRCLAIEMVKRGWTVIGVARREEKLKELEHELGAMTPNPEINFAYSKTVRPDASTGSAEGRERTIFVPYACDVSMPERVQTVSQDMKTKGLRPTLFFLNAGMGDVETPFKPMLAIHQQTFDTNYFGVVSWVDEWINDVKSLGGGTFVATSSVNAIYGDGASYCASKAALVACFNTLRRQYQPEGIGFVLVLPGPVNTTMLKVPHPLPFTHEPEADAKYIIEQVFKGKKQIEPSWVYSYAVRLLSWLGD